jgi:hypothetical protein
MKGTWLISFGLMLVVAVLILAFSLDRSGQNRPDQTGRAPEEAAGPDRNDSLVGSESGASAADAPASQMTEPAADQPPAASPAQPPSVAAAIPETSAEQPKAAAPAAATEDSPKSQPQGPKPPADREQLAFKEWPAPKVALIVTGEQLGYFEPCGCTANQLGGMNRRADLVRQMTDLGWTVRGVDVGTISRRTVRQAQIKFETTMTALRDLKYLAIGLGPEELRLDPGYLISQHITDGPDSLSFLSANLVFYGSADLGTPLAYRIVEVDGLKIGITSILSQTLKQTVIPDRPVGTDASAADITWSDPAEALTGVMKHFEDEGAQFLILLSQASVEESRQLAKDFPKFDLVVTAQGFGEGEKTAEDIGTVKLLQVGEKGKHAGVVGIYPEDSANPLRFELITLSGQNFGESEAMIEHMKSYQERLKDEQIVIAETEVGHQSGASFVGAAKCGECHTSAFSIWKDTAHAHAFESLDPANGRKGNERLHGVSRTFDPECLSCHVTGWDPQEYLRFRSGFLNQEFAAAAAKTPDEEPGLLQLQELLAGNQCENCHGPGSRHIELIDAGKIEESRAEVRVTLDQARNQTCVKCHDGDNSPDFKFDEYWESVKHPGLD